MKYITFSRHFPAGHSRKGEPTWFVEKILSSILPRNQYGILDLNSIPASGRHIVNDFALIDNENPKPHTIRNGSRFSPREMVSLRVWQLPGGRYVKGNKQIEFAQVEVKKVWSIEINNRFGAGSFEVVINGVIYAQLHNGNDVDLNRDGLITLAKNDGLELEDFVSWFNMHPKKKDAFRGQIIAWGDGVEY